MSSSDPIAHVEHERRLQRLIRRLPGKIQAITRWLRRPASRWARIPAGVLLTIGGRLSILPFFGLWMLPLGLILLADDIPLLRRARGWARPDGAAQAALVRRRRRPRGSDGRGGKQRIVLFPGTAAPRAESLIVKTPLRTSTDLVLRRPEGASKDVSAGESRAVDAVGASFEALCSRKGRLRMRSVPEDVDVND
jgi:hypothetical protein